MNLISTGVGCQNRRFTPGAIEILRRVVHTSLGINISTEKNYLLISKFSRMMDDLGIRDADELIGCLENPGREIELKMAKYLTTNHTFFFREALHFDLLGQLARQQGLHRPRIWCAASSSGEEVYSIAITLFEAGISDFLLLASDISLDMLKVCQAGIYRPERVAGIPKHLLYKYFDSVKLDNGCHWLFKPEFRQNIILKRLNLMDNLRFEQFFHFIFCRNVMIYFDGPTQKGVVSRLIANLEPDGHLFVGHSEPLLNINERVVQVAPSTYRKPKW